MTVDAAAHHVDQRRELGMQCRPGVRQQFGQNWPVPAFSIVPRRFRELQRSQGVSTE